MAEHEDDVDAGAKISESGFGGADSERDSRLKALKERLDEELRAAMLKSLDQARAELEAGTLHGLVVLRVNNDHETAASIAICNMAAREVGAKLQEISMDLMLPAGAAREIRGLIEMLGGIGRVRS